MSKIEEAMRRLQGDLAPRGVERSLLDESGSDTGRRSRSGGIARMRESGLREPAELDRLRLIYPGAPDTRTVNAFRQLRTSLLRRAGHRNFLLMVAGTGERAGGSFVAANLAAAIALDGTKTALLVDCDLGNPTSSHLALGDDEPLPGLTDFLNGFETAVERIIHPTGVARLRAIPAGRFVGAAQESFSGPQLRHLFDELLGRYPDRYIVVDAPAVADSADARILAELCNHVLLVVPYARNTAGQIESAVAAVPEEHFVGAVINDEPFWPLRD